MYDFATMMVTIIFRHDHWHNDNGALSIEILSLLSIILIKVHLMIHNLTSPPPFFSKKVEIFIPVAKPLGT